MYQRVNEESATLQKSHFSTSLIEWNACACEWASEFFFERLQAGTRLAVRLFRKYCGLCGRYSRYSVSRLHFTTNRYVLVGYFQGHICSLYEHSQEKANINKACGLSQSMILIQTKISNLHTPSFTRNNDSKRHHSFIEFGASSLSKLLSLMLWSFSLDEVPEHAAYSFTKVSLIRESFSTGKSVNFVTASDTTRSKRKTPRQSCHLWSFKYFLYIYEHYFTIIKRSDMLTLPFPKRGRVHFSRQFSSATFWSSM